MIIARLVVSYPQQALWFLMAVSKVSIWTETFHIKIYNNLCSHFIRNIKQLELLFIFQSKVSNFHLLFSCDICKWVDWNTSFMLPYLIFKRWVICKIGTFHWPLNLKLLTDKTKRCFCPCSKKLKSYNFAFWFLHWFLTCLSHISVVDPPNRLCFSG
jgi:hypothetical protein